MKVLFLSNLYPPNVLGGYERLAFQVAEALAARGHEIGVLTSAYGGKVADYDGQRIWRSLALFATEGNIYQPFSASDEDRDRAEKANVAELDKVVAEFKPDVVFAWNMYFYGSDFVTKLDRIETPLVYFLTDNWIISFFNGQFIGDYFAEALQGRRRDSAAAGVQPVAKLRGRAVFGSKFVKSLHDEAGLAFSGSEIIHNGVELPNVPETRYRDRVANVRYGELRLLYAGRIVEVKGIHRIIEALPAVRRGLPGVAVTLDIVGESADAAYRKRLEEMIEEAELGPIVRFREPVAGDRLFDLFQDYDVYLFSSIYEPFALTLIHALHAGVPTVASATGGNVEIVEDRETGLLYDKNDAAALAAKIVLLQQRPMLRKRLSRRARRVAWGFEFRQMVDRIEASLRLTVAK